jgi:hypothetical protein
MLFHKNNRNKFVTAGKKLETETSFKSVTEFFEAQFTTNKNDGMPKRMELKRTKNCAHLKLKNKLCNKICARTDEHCTYRTKHKIASRNAQRRPYDYHKEQCWYINHDCDHDRAYNDKHQAAKHPCIERPSYRNRKDDHCNNQPKKEGISL